MKQENNVNETYGELIKLGEQIDKVAAKDPILKKISEYPSNNGKAECKNVRNQTNDGAITNHIYSMDTGISVSTGAGAPNIIKDGTNAKREITNLLSQDEDNFDINKTVIDTNIVFDTVKDLYKLDDNDTRLIIEIANKYKAAKANNKKIGLYNLLPESLKKMIKQECTLNGNISKEVLNLLAEEYINQVIRDSTMDQLFIDFNTELSNVFKENMPTINKYLIDDILNKKKFLYEKADQIQDEHPDNAIKLRKIGDAYEEAYTYSKFIDAIKHHTFKIRHIDLEKFCKVFDRFKIKYENSKLTINDVSKLPFVIKRILSRKRISFYEEDPVLFVMAFCKYTDSFSPVNLDQHTFMYYFIYNLIYLDIYITSDADQQVDDFFNSLLEKVTEVISLLHENYNV